MTAILSNGTAQRSVVLFAAKLGFPPPVHIGDGLYACVAEITPDMALEILTAHHIENNRNQKAWAISTYAGDMKSGVWMLTHQGICFGDNFLLFDGQNRLQACIESETPFRTIVFFMAPIASAVNVDGGVKRSVTDAARFSGRNLSHRTSSILRCVAHGPRALRWSNHAAFNAADVLKEAVAFIDKAIPRSIPKVTIAPVMGAIGRAYFHVDETRLPSFCNVLRSGLIVEAKEDTAAQVLFKWLMVSNHAGANNSSEAYYKTENAIDKYVKRIPLAKIYEADGEMYPLPEHIKGRLDL